MNCSTCTYQLTEGCPLQQKKMFVSETKDVITKGFCGQWMPLRQV